MMCAFYCYFYSISAQPYIFCGTCGMKRRIPIVYYASGAIAIFAKPEV